MQSVPWLDYSPYQPDAPAICISWDMAQPFMDRLNTAMGLTVYRLPTEEEWENAAGPGRLRSGTSAISRRDSQTMSRTTTTQPVSAAARSPKSCKSWGLYDMYGSGREWCANRPYSYVDSSFIGPHVDSPRGVVEK